MAMTTVDQIVGDLDEGINAGKAAMILCRQQNLLSAMLRSFDIRYGEEDIPEEEGYFVDYGGVLVESLRAAVDFIQEIHPNPMEVFKRDLMILWIYDKSQECLNRFLDLDWVESVTARKAPVADSATDFGLN